MSWGFGLCSQGALAQITRLTLVLGEPPFLGSSLLGEGEQSLSERGVATNSDKYQAMLSARSRHPAETATAQPHWGPVCHEYMHPVTTLPFGDHSQKGQGERTLSQQEEGATVIGSQ